MPEPPPPHGLRQTRKTRQETLNPPDGVSGAVHVAWAALATMAAFTALRAIWGDRVWLLIVWGAYTPFVLLPAYLSLAVGARHGQRLLALGSLALVVLHLHAVLPQAFCRAPSLAAQRSHVRVVSANGNGWNPAPSATLRTLARYHADVVCLQEVSPRWADALRDEGWLEEYPHRSMDVREGVWGMALLSRHPLQQVRAHELNEAQGIEARVEHGGRLLTFLCVHPAPPAGHLTDSHRSALERIVAWTAAHADESAVVLGDFNSTPYSAFSDAMRPHVDDAWELAGSLGLGHTWPNSGLLYPPARLDHIYVTRSLGVSHAELALAASSDHAPVVADVVLRVP